MKFIRKDGSVIDITRDEFESDVRRLESLDTKFRAGEITIEEMVEALFDDSPFVDTIFVKH